MKFDTKDFVCFDFAGMLEHIPEINLVDRSPIEVETICCVHQLIDDWIKKENNNLEFVNIDTIKSVGIFFVFKKKADGK